MTGPLRLTVLQIDNRLPHDTLTPAEARPVDAQVRVNFVTRNRALTAQRGWTHIVNTTGYPHLPPWWWKVFGIRDLFRADPDPASLLALWLDTDAVLTQCTGTDPVRLAQSDVFHCMWISRDVSLFNSPFNAGAFLVRGTPAGRRLIADWCGLYDAYMWRMVPTIASAGVRIGMQKQSDAGPRQWENVVGPWAGVAFEQGSFVAHILPHAARYGVRVLPYYVFNEVDCTAPHRDSVCVHLHDTYVTNRCGPETCVGRRPA